MQTVVQSLLFLLASLLLALGGMMLVRRSTRLSALEAHREIAGFVYATIGVIYAVLLAFVCIVTWERYADASQTATREADAVTTLTELAQGFGSPGRQQVQGQLLRYTEAVLAAEWSHMGVGSRAEDGQQVLNQLWLDYARLPPSDQQLANYGESLRQMSELQNERGERWEYADEVIPRVVWLTLVLGAAITIAFTYLFGVKSALAQGLITTAITVTVSGVLILTFILDDPFRGAIAVQPQQMESARTLIVAELAQSPAAALGEATLGRAPSEPP